MGKIKSIVSDWNGTLIKDKDEAPILKGLGLAVLKASMNPFHPLRKSPNCRFFHLIETKHELELLYKKRQQDPNSDSVEEMYRIFNENVVKGLPIGFISDFINEYSADYGVQERLDSRIIHTIIIKRHILEKAGIISSGYEYGVTRIMEESMYYREGFRFDFIKGNNLETQDEVAIGFSLDNYEKKHIVLEAEFRKEKFEPGTCAYIGDSIEDIGCMPLAKYPIISFLATDGFKQYAASTLNAFVPETQLDLMDYIEKA